MPQPVISLVVARGRNGVIGRDGDLPWRLRSDLQRFKAITIGKPCLMGRKTWESLPLRPLPGRLNLVLTRDQSYEAEGMAKGALVCATLDEAIEIARETAEEENVDEICIIGGTALFEAALPRARRLYVTEVDAAPEGDARFPDFDPADWTEVSSEPHEAGEKDDHAFTFRVLERR
ncbi:dihydrofolate reductase [Brevundimonas sp.]|uniref:dihydrofolate reductase n=1 Tax=Brevundimonas sp. TaxID=1871086 RepID=UPI001AC309FC|nr:dihydrofolate reductase [Brevundimonas sp.]MBN9464379.1 dihydrofolate reductase [Brevundimonas sp.]